MQISKNVKRVLLIMLVLVFFLLGIACFKAALSGKVATIVFNNYMSQLEESGENIDMLLLGGSRVYRSLDPDVFEEELGIDVVVNSATPSQKPELSYYLLKEVLKKHHPKYLVLGATYNGIKGKQSISSATMAMDRISLVDRTKYLIDSFGIAEGLMVSTGKQLYSSNLTISRIKDNIDKKYITKDVDFESKWIVRKGNGFNGTKAGLNKGNVPLSYDKAESSFDADDVNPSSASYYDKILELCKENNIKVVLVSGVATSKQLYCVRNYQDAIDYYTEYAHENNIEYFNLNYLKNREEIFPDDKFMDHMHLNYEGGETCSRIFADILKDYYDGKDTSKYFYKDFDEYTKDVNRVVAIAAEMKDTTSDEITINIKSLQNADVVPQYRVLAGKKTNSDNPDKLVEITSWDSSDSISIRKSDIAKYEILRVEGKAGENDPYYAYKIIKLI